MANERVTLREVYDIVERIEGKFDKRFNDHEQRIRANEGWKNRAIGVAGILSAFVSIMASWLWNAITQN